MYEMDLATAKQYGKPPPESRARVKSTGCMNALVPSTSTGIRSLLISDGAPAYVSLAKKKKIKLLQCNHSKGIFSKWVKVYQRNWVRAHTGGVDGYWKVMKKSIPDSIRSQVQGKRNAMLFEYIRSHQWRWEHTGFDLLSVTGEAVRSFMR